MTQNPIDQLSPEELGRLRSVKSTPPLSTFRTIFALILREMSATYGRSPGGYLWAILEPVLGIAVLVAIFSIGFRSPPLGKNFALFYATGMMPLWMFTTTSTKVSQAINFSRQLLSYPRVTFLDAVLARFILNVATQALNSTIILSVILMVYDTRTTFILPRVLSAYLMASCLGLGVGMLLCTLISRHPLWQMVWSVITRPLMLISGVILLHETLPRPYSTWLNWNPLVHVTGEMRTAFYYSYHAEYLNPGYVYLVALICGTLGLFFLRRYYRDMMEK
ncbi:ABC transporter permease [Thioclava sp. FTW29]|uniref:Transport permease protein n=1 Tax=Thioclava litoralis TaxID=3076557 RepID=A0ABZ1E421_9RHOB|nr:ABC transporter permease [Thioclava sp. FTW29]